MIYCCEEAISQCSRFLSFLIHFHGIVHFRRLIAIKSYYHVKWNHFESLRVIIMEILAKILICQLYQFMSTRTRINCNNVECHCFELLESYLEMLKDIMANYPELSPLSKSRVNASKTFPPYFLIFSNLL